ncbi:MAG: methionyl-tRNA formyltransferase [Candidatus Paceibacterota bacterium]
MKFVFWGTPRFAEIVLKELLQAGFKPETVVCNPDRLVGRKKILTPPPVKILAEEKGIKVFQPEILDENFIEELKKINPDFFAVAAYAKIIPKEILEIPRLGSIGIHPSLLPDLRGATPIQTAIIKGYKESGVSLYLMDEKMDHGPILGQKGVILETKGQKMGYLEAEKALGEEGGKLIAKILPDFINGKIEPKEQNHEKATFTKKIKTEDGLVEIEDLKEALNGNPEKAKEIEKKILAFNPEPGVYVLNPKRIKLLEAEIKEEILVLKKIQIEGKKPVEKFSIDIFK